MSELIPGPEIDFSAMHHYRLKRIYDEMENRQIHLSVIVSPTNLRYAVNFDEYQLFQSHIPMFYLLLSPMGPVTLAGASNQIYPLVEEYIPSVGFNVFDSGFNYQAASVKFLDQVREYLSNIGISEKEARIAFEPMPANTVETFLNAGIQLFSADSILEKARIIKSPLEIDCIKHSIAVAELGMNRMFEKMRPGLTENQLWAILHETNIANGGEWTEGRMLASGSRTNPWLQEASHKVIQAGELVAFDTDMAGPNGYFADISRTWLCDSHQPDPLQKQAYQHAYEEVHFNIELLEPGISFDELMQKSYDRQPQFKAHRYPCAFHGVGMSDEYPKLYYPEDSERQYDGEIEVGMVLCVESFSGSDQGGEGVKLEQMVHVTESGIEVLSNYGFEADLL